MILLCFNASTRAEQVPEGVELTIQKMKPGETAEVALPASLAFGQEGATRPGGTAPVPAGAEVTYTIQLQDVQNVRLISEQ